MIPKLPLSSLTTVMYGEGLPVVVNGRVVTLQSTARQRRLPVGRASDTSTALALGSARPADLASEIDTALVA